MGGVVLEGAMLHRGGISSLGLTRTGGALRFVQRGASATLDEMIVERADRGVTVATRDGRIRLDLVEHLLAAIAGLGVGGVEIACDAPEIPILDGGAARFVTALRALDAPREPPGLVVTRAATIARGESTYRFEPGAAVHVEVSVSFRPPFGEERATWSGDPDDFATRIAPARTFGWIDEALALSRAGRALGAHLGNVLVLDERGAVPGCAPPADAELARHKLLDLLGDLRLYGGPPRGRVEARRPGHAATHDVVRAALAAGLLARTGAS